MLFCGKSILHDFAGFVKKMLCKDSMKEHDNCLHKKVAAAHEKTLDKAERNSYNNTAKQSRYGITHLTPAQRATGG